MEAALAPALREEVDLVVHSGDLFDRSAPPSDAIATARKLLGEAARRVPVVLMPGNHDRRGLAATVGGLSGVRVCDGPERVVVGGVSFGMVPFVRTAEQWANQARDLGRVDLWVAHQAFHGVRVPGFMFRVGAQADTIGAGHLPPGATDVACGHLHPRQIVDVGGVRVVCPGSTERTAFSEAGDTKGYAIWTFGARWGVRFVDLATRALAVVHTEEDLDRVGAGTVVRAPIGLEREVRARGGWTVRVRRQLRLFA